MKFLLVLGVLSVASVAGACPDLSGTFVCPATDGDPESILNVSQETNAGVTTYTVVDSTEAYPMTVIADGVARTEKNVETNPDGSTQTTYVTSNWSCAESQLNGNMDATFDPNPNKVTASATFNVVLTGESDLATASHLVVKDESGKAVQEENDTTICKRSIR